MNRDRYGQKAVCGVEAAAAAARVRRGERDKLLLEQAAGVIRMDSMIRSCVVDAPGTWPKGSW